MEEKHIVAIYTRVSTREQAIEGYSLDAQKRILIDFCKLKEYKIYKIYTDEGISAKDLKHRPGILQLLEDAKEKKFNIILVWKLTRFSRNMVDLTSVCDILDKSGISLVSYSESFDSSTPSGRMVRSMLGTVGQFEREVISENIKMGLLERVIQGKRPFNGLGVIGYDFCGKDSLTVNEDEARYVNFVHDNYIKLECASKVAAKAKENGYRGKMGKLPSPHSIYSILTNPVYAGYYSYKGNIYKGNFEPIRTIEEFNTVQYIILKQSQKVGKKLKRKIHIIPD